LTRFVHTSDLHLGKPFGRFEENVRVRLREARHERIASIAQIARDNDAGSVLLAGDTFDAETPSPQVIRHALRAFAAEADITWFIMPGNHDSLAAGDLWDRMMRDCPDNVVLALEAKPVLLGDDAVILPAPPTSRAPGRDLTEWMNEASYPQMEDRIRIGLAHGSIQDFGDPEGGASGIIPPDRAQLSNLDYLALGDWHGRIRVGPRCWYSGTPEADSFKHQSDPGVLLVDIAARGTLPVVTEIPAGKFTWLQTDVDLRPGEDLEDRIEQAVPDIRHRRDALVEMSITGRLGLSDRAIVEASLSSMADDFAFFEADLSKLAIDQQAGDLDDIDSGGALRAAAEVLAASAQDESRSEADRQVSSAALARLYAYATGDAS
jgi:DNA repair exonuclease SbcCD nuclease subunit